MLRSELFKTFWKINDSITIAIGILFYYTSCDKIAIYAETIRNYMVVTYLI